jgi:hypothetical protein
VALLFAKLGAFDLGEVLWLTIGMDTYGCSVRSTSGTSGRRSITAATTSLPARFTRCASSGASRALGPDIPVGDLEQVAGGVLAARSAVPSPTR